ncbi:MAG: hypothetical protein SCM96_15160 [Acidobacteriota bacterium]|nr:hypothetical protein [Acidobacteriota bacterium]
MTPKRKILLSLKNLFGFKTQKKIVVFSTDDYGNVRIADRNARENMRKAGLNVEATRFDLYDSLEKRDDLAALYETLTSVKDKNGNHAVFTAMTSVANPDYERIKADHFQQYHYELIPETFAKLPGYEGTWDLWKEGIEKRLIRPQFHGREHLNLKFFMRSLQTGNHQAMTAFNNRSFGAITDRIFPGIGYTEAFSFNEFRENDAFKDIIVDGLNAFEKVFGFRARHFAAPGAREHRTLEPTMKECGIKYIDNDFLKAEHQGNGKIKRSVNYTGKTNKQGQIYIVRNCLFEPVQLPNVPEIDWVSYALSQIEIAFKWNKPANISGHRVNYIGNIEPAVREKGLAALKRLLKEIVRKWPDIEFMTTVELGELIESSKSGKKHSLRDS